MRPTNTPRPSNGHAHSCRTDTAWSHTTRQFGAEATGGSTVMPNPLPHCIPVTIPCTGAETSNTSPARPSAAKTAPASNMNERKDIRALPAMRRFHLVSAQGLVTLPVRSC